MLSKKYVLSALLTAALVLCLIPRATPPLVQPAHASGTCSGNIGATFEIDPGYDYLAINVLATGATGCSSPLYQFAFWNGSAREVFCDYSSSSSASWDTHNLTGTAYVSIYVKDSSSSNQYDTYSPWISYSLTPHGYGDTFDTRATNSGLQNMDPQGSAADSKGNPTPWLSTYIEYLPNNNGVADQGTPACGPSNRIYSWQGAYTVGMPGAGANGYAFVQPGFDYFCNGTGGYTFAVSETSEAINCPNGGGNNFQATDDMVINNGTQVTASPKSEYKGCYVPVTLFGFTSGSIANFDMHSDGSTFYIGVNGTAIFSASESAEGLVGPWLDTEIAGLYQGIGSNLNQGMRLYTAITESWYYDDTIRRKWR